MRVLCRWRFWILTGILHRSPCTLLQKNMPMCPLLHPRIWLQQSTVSTKVRASDHSGWDPSWRSNYATDVVYVNLPMPALKEKPLRNTEHSDPWNIPIRVIFSTTDCICGRCISPLSMEERLPWRMTQLPTIFESVLFSKASHILDSSQFSEG